MGFFNKYPYTDFHELNLDWALSTVKELDDKFNLVVNEKLKEFLYEHLSDMFINVLYNEENERLILTLDSKFFGDGEHVYNVNNESMEII